jgi:hypothetical protein
MADLPETGARRVRRLPGCRAPGRTTLLSRPAYPGSRCALTARASAASSGTSVTSTP